MHIPDGYRALRLARRYMRSPLRVVWGAATVKRLLSTRTIPLISVFAAFCFVVMMFNVLLPGGTTGHAAGSDRREHRARAFGIHPGGLDRATIQALFFGDGGITTLGANCLNMAIVGSLVAYSVYHLIAAKAKVSARRRVVAAAVAGYLLSTLRRCWQRSSSAFSRRFSTMPRGHRCTRLIPCTSRFRR